MHTKLFILLDHLKAHFAFESCIKDTGNVIDKYVCKAFFLSIYSILKFASNSCCGSLYLCGNNTVSV